MSSQNGKVASEAAQLRLRGVQGPLWEARGPDCGESGRQALPEK